MRCPGGLCAFAERVGAIDSFSGYIVAFLIVLALTAAWGDISKFFHPRPIEQSENQDARI
jgi:hypothetical protein